MREMRKIVLAIGIMVLIAAALYVPTLFVVAPLGRPVCNMCM